MKSAVPLCLLSACSVASWLLSLTLLVPIASRQRPLMHAAFLLVTVAVAVTSSLGALAVRLIPPAVAAWRLGRVHAATRPLRLVARD